MGRICPDPLPSRLEFIVTPMCRRRLNAPTSVFTPARERHARHEGAKPPFVVDDLVSACESRRFEILVMDMMKTRLTCTDIQYRDPSDLAVSCPIMFFFVAIASSVTFSNREHTVSDVHPASCLGILLPARRQKYTREMKGITGSPQKAAWLKAEFEIRPIEQERMPELELNPRFSWTPLEEKHLVK